MKNRWVYDKLYSQGATSLTDITTKIEGLNCSAGHALQQGLILGKTLASGSSIQEKALLDEGLRMLILHEVGHTLGLNHNMKASILWDEKDVHKKSLTKGILTGSVMDYTPANIAPIGITQGDYFQVKSGPYDLWAIEYGYSTALTDKIAEQQRLNKILSHSADKGLAFGNDADDMRPQVFILILEL